jgi:phosphohistidine phosphatase
MMRHSKAEQGGTSDMGRVLADRGRVDAAAAGRWLAEWGFVPDHALVSSAERTKETWSVVADAAGWDVEPEYDTGLYAAGPETALDLVREVPSDVRSLIVVGHNPTIAYLVQMLDSGDGDAAAADAMADGFPTSATCVLEYDGAWADLDMGSAAVVAFHVGRG